MLLKHLIDIFPFHLVPQGGRIVLWGMGQVGKQYLNQIRVTAYCKVEYVVDVHAGSIADLPLKIHSPEYICENPVFDFIVISIGNRTVAAQVKERLLAWGIGHEKIVFDMRRYMETLYFSDNRIALPDATFYREIRRLLRVHRATGYALVRVGNPHDGGYIMLDDFRPGGIAYSFGISDEISWDIAMEERGYDVFMYDHTVDALPETREGFHFIQKGISGSIVTEEMDTLGHYLAQNGHARKDRMILKMDVEGSEWEFLASIPSDTLAQFDQIVMEMHGFLNVDFVDRIIAGLRKLDTTHFVVHVHANNSGNEIQHGNLRMADALEVTWICRTNYSFEDVEVILPLEIDAPCAEGVPDVELGRWNDEVYNTGNTLQ